MNRLQKKAQQVIDARWKALSQKTKDLLGLDIEERRLFLLNTWLLDFLADN